MVHPGQVPSPVIACGFQASARARTTAERPEPRHRKAAEIERKLLVTGAGWRQLAGARKAILQEFVCAESDRAVDVRFSVGQAKIAIKGAGKGIERLEYEYALSPVFALRRPDFQAAFAAPGSATRFLHIPAADQFQASPPHRCGCHSLHCLYLCCPARIPVPNCILRPGCALLFSADQLLERQLVRRR
jgi:hypothetical protein